MLILFSSSSDNYQYGTINIGQDNLTDSLGIELWINTTSNSDPILYRKDGFNNDEAYWSLEVESGLLHFKGLTQDGISYDLSSSSAVNNGWTHCAVYVRSDSIKMLVPRSH